MIRNSSSSGYGVLFLSARDMGVLSSVVALSVDGDLAASRNLTFDFSLAIASLRMSEGDFPLNFGESGVSIIDS